MKLPRELTTVTLLSKTLALFLLIFLPLLGFLLGMQYQQDMQRSRAVLQIKQEPTNNQVPLQNADAMLYNKKESWGPCPPGGEPCRQETILYFTGRLVFSGNKNAEQNLDQKTVQRIIAKIEETGIMEKNCDAPPVMDYLATYKITLNNITKRIIAPGCHFELRSIEDVFLQ